jgi:hypothetical protein
MAWIRSYPAASAERIAGEVIAAICYQFSVVRNGGTRPSYQAVYDDIVTTINEWAHWSTEPTRRVGYSRYYQVVKRLRIRLERKVLPQHKRLKSWTVHGIRSMVAGIGYDALPPELMPMARTLLTMCPQIEELV